MNNPVLKLAEPDINKEMDLWLHDALERKPIADALSNLFKDETQSLTISLNGGWGSGKTFLLRRLHAQLNKDCFRAIYFNAWEDDFCGDPLMAIIGQLWESLKGTDSEEIAAAIKETAKPLFTQTIFNVVNVATAGTIDLAADQLRSAALKTVDEYFEQRTNKNELKKRLTEMAAEVAKVTSHPLVFIIDELDRCRPTFSIELLERVKHIFDVPNIIFVFGIDRNQLASSIKAVYGEIDVDGYLRRFFDMDFVLPVADARKFCRHLMKRHGMAEYFENRSEKADNTIHSKEYDEFADFFSKLCYQLGLSLREIEQCIRSFVFVAKNIPDKHYMFPLLLSVLLLVRLKNQQLYVRFAKGECRSGEMLNYIEGYFEGAENRDVAHFLDVLEINLYVADYDEYSRGGDVIKSQLSCLAEGKPLTFPGHISSRTAKADSEKAKKLLEWYDHSLRQLRFAGAKMASRRSVHEYLIPKIELTLMMQPNAWT